jgi:hypothetical protein
MQFSAPSLNGLAQLALSVMTGNEDAHFYVQRIVSTARNAAPGGNDKRMSNMPMIPYQTLSGTFAPRRSVVNAAA